MGKVRRERTKRHNAAAPVHAAVMSKARPADDDDDLSSSEDEMDEDEARQLDALIGALGGAEDHAGGAATPKTSMSLSARRLQTKQQHGEQLVAAAAAAGSGGKKDLREQLEDLATVTALDKKSKRTLRHLRFMKKLKTAETVREAEKKAKETPKSSLRSMNLLNDALLTSLESSSAATLAKKKASAQQQNRQPKSRKGRAQVLMRECLQMQSVLNHPAFQANPTTALHQHLLNSTKAGVL
eukprot:m.183677 g.183677  ORF g.183677 m.183677 type:complete len:241 (-) comp17478_c1_seq1:1822-2544(-)